MKKLYRAYRLRKLMRTINKPFKSMTTRERERYELDVYNKLKKGMYL